jgi:hypothetical protein
MQTLQYNTPFWHTLHKMPVIGVVLANHILNTSGVLQTHAYDTDVGKFHNGKSTYVGKRQYRIK